MDALRFQIVVDGQDAIPAAMAEASASVQQAVASSGEHFKTLQGHSERAGERVTYSMTQARHAIRGLGEEVGIHMPRFVSSFLADIPAVGAAMAAAFSVIAVVGLIEVLGQIPEALSKAIDWFDNFGEREKKALKEGTDEVMRHTMHLIKLHEAARDAAAGMGKEGTAKIDAQTGAVKKTAEEQDRLKTSLEAQLKAVRDAIDANDHWYVSMTLGSKGLADMKDKEEAVTAAIK